MLLLPAVPSGARGLRYSLAIVSNNKVAKLTFVCFSKWAAKQMHRINSSGHYCVAPCHSLREHDNAEAELVGPLLLAITNHPEPHKPILHPRLALHFRMLTGVPCEPPLCIPNHAKHAVIRSLRIIRW